ncbi:hypothetical protein MIND_01371600 [Mycena indigotica]|uniref:Uncharacterized protein n=1 Tax=Mycena indigotica TaxID=2126181 RepID=A0A8H6RZS7_9AGAR|nr:uncharacterized protein MIND_01371600 [Mycena indigotica]KAF7289963.1 hypothetical protein MIND_01371600 [Mycena indigotica]
MYAPSRAYAYPQAPAGFPQVPFNGPPPKPPHIRANPQDWQNGSWSINPAFNASQWSVSSAAAAWVPSQSWAQRQAAEWQVQQQQMAAAAHYNPFKRVPRPPSAEYLATKLSDNPLGLINMIPRETLFGPKTDGMAAATPWVWNPRNLQDEDNDTEPETAPTSNSGPTTNSAPPPNSAPPIYARAQQPQPDVPDQSRRATTVPARHSSEPPAERRQSFDDRPRRHNQPDDIFTSRELQPTFSTNIVRTPDHYRTRSSSAGPSPSPQPIYGPPATPRRASVDSDLSNRMERLNTNSLSRHASLPAPLSAPATSTFMTSGSALVEEPGNLLSPLVGISSNHKHSPRPLGPSSSLNTIPEGFDNDSTRRSPKRKSKSANRRSRHTSPVPHSSASSPPLSNMFGIPPPMNVYQSAPPNGQESVTPPHNLTPPHNPTGSSSLTPPHSAQLPNITPPRASSHSAFATPTHQPVPASYSHHSSYSTPDHSLLASSYSSPTHPSTYSQQPLQNPLPAPPQEPVSREPDLRIPIQRPVPDKWRTRKRMGMWNRRGDHLTMDGYIVYAPSNRAYPEELSDYPAENVGYRDHRGSELKYLERPELPESLPRHGQPPLQPYDKFVVYEYQQ